MPDPNAPDDPDDDDHDGRVAAFPKEAVAALATQRKQKKELKAQVRTLTEELGALKARLGPADGDSTVQTPGQPAAPTPHPSPLSPQPSPELAAAEQTVAEQEDLRNWARRETKALQLAVANGADVTPILANLQAQVAAHKITLPNDSEGVLAWLEGVQTKAADTLDVARGDVRFLRQQSEQLAAESRAEGEAFARQFVPKMFEANTEEAKRAALIKQRIPGIEQLPLGMRFLAAAVRGWEVIKAQIEAAAPPGNHGKANGAPTNGKTATVTLPAKTAARLPGAPAVVPLRPQEGAESSSAIFQRYIAAMNNPQASEQEREQLKQQWTKAAVGGR